MALSTSQLQSLKTDITVAKAAVLYNGQTLLQWWNNGSNSTIAEFYNQTASPAVLIWKPDVRTQDLVDALVGTEYVSGTTATDVARRALLDVITRSELVDATKSQVRSNFSTAAAAASSTLTAWTAIARRNATYLEALFAGVPSGGASVTPLYNYSLTNLDVAEARNV